MKKKIITLLVLAVAAGGIAFFTRPKIDAVPKVTPEIEQQAVEQVRNYIEAVRKNDYRQLRAVSAFADRASAESARQLVSGIGGSGFQFAGSDMEDGDPNRISLIGILPSGSALRVSLAKTDKSYKITAVAVP